MNLLDKLPKVLQDKIFEYNADHRTQWEQVMRNLIMYDMYGFDDWLEWEDAICLNSEEKGLYDYYRGLSKMHLFQPKLQLKNRDKLIYEVSKRLKILLNDVYIDFKDRLKTFYDYDYFSANELYDISR